MALRDATLLRQAEERGVFLEEPRATTRSESAGRVRCYASTIFLIQPPENLVGAPHVTVTIRNPAEPERTWDGLFLVDTGVTDSLVPRNCVEALGLKSEGQRVYETADGREVRLDFARAFIEFMGDLTAGRVVIADNDAEPLLGVTALESAGIEVDPVNQRLKRLPALRLKRAT